MVEIGLEDWAANVTLAGHESQAGAARRRQARLGAGKAAR